MSERWKFQTKTGLIWGFLMIIILTAYDGFALPFSETFSLRMFLIRLVLFPATGVFLFGYFMWKYGRKKSEKP